VPVRDRFPLGVVLQASLSSCSRSHILPAVDGPCFADPAPAVSVSWRDPGQGRKTVCRRMRQTSLQGCIYGVSFGPGPDIVLLRCG